MISSSYQQKKQIRMSEQTVKVVVRVRPILQKEKTKKSPDFITYDLNEKQIAFQNPNVEQRIKKIFCFDDLFVQDSQQQQVYERTCMKLVADVVEGYNGTIFAYGQTGSGKTYTMMGSSKSQEEKGIIPRCFQSILERAKADSSKDFLIMCSFIELYNEEIRDLLGASKQKLELRESPEQGIFIKDLKKVSVTSEQEMMKYLKIGSQNRTTAETLMNSESSRSHSIMTIYVQSLEQRDEGQKLIGSKFNLVDLAGSERQSKTGATGERFNEATKINLSLTALGKVITSLVQGKGSFVPYRDSKLTRLLQDSLGGNSKTIMIATISPLASNFEETISTLKYASRAKYITNAPVINRDPKDALLLEYENEIKRLRIKLKEIQCVEHPEIDHLKEQNEKLTRLAEEQKKQLLKKIRTLEEKVISPNELSEKLMNQRNRREQKLSFMERNYKNLEEEVKQMRELLTELRRKYKNASKEIFQLENEHEREREKIEEEYDQMNKENIIYKSVLSILFTPKQLNNLISLGTWEEEDCFKLPTFYFKDRHTLAFPCGEEEGKESHRSKQKRDKNLVKTAQRSFYPKKK